MFDFIIRFIITRKARNEEGASAVEYGLLIAGIAALVALVVFGLGGAISGLFEDMTGDINGPAGG